MHIATNATQDSPSAPTTPLDMSTADNFSALLQADDKTDLSSIATELVEELKQPLPWVLPNSGLSFEKSSMGEQIEIRNQLLGLDIENRGHRAEIQTLLSLLNCRLLNEGTSTAASRFTEGNRQIVWTLDPYSTTKMIEICLDLIEALPKAIPDLAEPAGVKIAKHADKNLNYTVYKVTGHHGHKQNLSLVLHHDHHYYSPVIGALNERITVNSLRVNGANYSEQKLAETIEKLSSLIPGLNLGLPNGDTMRGSSIMLAELKPRANSEGEIVGPSLYHRGLRLFKKVLGTLTNYMNLSA